jgi:hypothetical protein
VTVMIGRWSCLALVVASGCATYSARTPEEALHSLARALRAADADAAYDLTSTDFRRRMPREAFREYVRTHPEDVATAADDLDRRPRRVEERATVELSAGERLELRRAPDGTWQLEEDAVDPYSQRTPRSAVRAFVRAYERRRWDVLVRLAPSSEAEGVTPEGLAERWQGEEREEIERLVAGLSEALAAGASIEEHGDHAVMPWGSGARAELLLEDGLWRMSGREP